MTQAPATRNFDPEWLRAKYILERDKRLRAEGANQYRYVDEEDFAQLDYQHDAYLPNGKPELRDSIETELDILLVGAGFAGMMTAIQLKKAGVDSFKMLDSAGDFGGTWYWNRYPGCRCDVESYIYLPLLEETGYMPTEKYVKATEILEHSRRVGRQFELYPHALFSTRVKSAEWDEQRKRWTVITDRGDTLRPRFFCVGSGPLNRPKLPGVPGVTSFKGHSFHTSRWDFDYTGGDPTNPAMTKLQDKRVGIIGTGATAVQCIPPLAQYAKELVVFQRTPSAVGFRNNHVTEAEWFKSQPAGWQHNRRLNFENLILGIPQEKDLIDDGWTQMWSKLMKLGGAVATENFEEQRQMADFEKMEEIRARIDAEIKDPKVAESLKPWYNMFCKRPLFGDDFLPTFNRPNVTLVDTDGRGVDCITERGVVFDGKEYEVDCLIYATGFDTLAPVYRAGGFDPVGRDGQTLGGKWEKDMVSLHGLLTHGFPNFFMVAQFKQAAVTINFPTIIDAQATHIASLLERCVRENIETFEITPEAERAWVRKFEEKATDSQKFSAECTPGYYNNEGSQEGKTIWNLVYGDGPFAFMDEMRDWRENRFETESITTNIAALVE